jgi:hypothetical protein
MRSLIFGVFLIFTSTLYAVTNAAVTQWTELALMHAFSVDFNYNNQNTAVRQQWFTPTAWQGINSFLRIYLRRIHEEKLTIHPQFLLKPRVVDSGVASGIHFWRVNSEMTLPELKIKIAFSVVVLKTNTPVGNSFIIQSLNMTKQEKP